MAINTLVLQEEFTSDSFGNTWPGLWDWGGSRYIYDTGATTYPALDSANGTISGYYSLCYGNGQNYAAPSGDISVLKTPMDLRNVQSAILTFKMCHDSTSSLDDAMEVLVGNTNDVSQAYALQAFRRYDPSVVGTRGQVQTHTVIIPDTVLSTPNYTFKDQQCWLFFRFTSRGGRHIYIDSVAVTGTIIASTPFLNTRIRWSVDGSIPWNYNYTTNSKTVPVLTSADGIQMADSEPTQGRGNWGSGSAMINFPAVLNLTGLGVKLINASNTGTQTTDNTFYVTGSLDSQDGLDGTWFNIPGVSPILHGIYTRFSFATPVKVKWLRFNCRDFQAVWACLHTFGAYDAPRMECWNAAGTARLDYTDYPLVFPDASNAYNYLQQLQFRIKNNTDSTHTYLLKIDQCNFIGDNLFNNNIFFPLDGKFTATPLIPAMGSNTNPSGVVSNKGSWGTPWQGFDQVVSTSDLAGTYSSSATNGGGPRYNAAGSYWVQYKFANPTIARSTKVYSYFLYINSLSIELLASNSGEFTGEEITLFKFDNLTDHDWNIPVFFGFDNETPYLYYRWFFVGKTNGDSSDFRFKEIQLYSEKRSSRLQVGIAPQSFSPVLVIAANIPKAENPADGTHTFSIDIKETS